MSEHAIDACGEHLRSAIDTGAAVTDPAQVLPFSGPQAAQHQFAETKRKPLHLPHFDLRISRATHVWGSVVIAALLTFAALAMLHAIAVRLGSSATPTAAPWAYGVMAVVFYAYATAVVFPFVLFLLWRASAVSPAANLAVLSPPYVSIVIPAFDEETHIARAVDCALAQDYPSFEVIVIDDGSRDLTKYVAGRFGSVLIPLRKNGGKAAALNAGLRQAKGDIVVFSDSDSFLDKAALRRLVRHFSNQNVGAVAGRVELERCSSAAQKLQALEYIFGQAVMKMAQAGSGASISVCPGPICAFRRSLLVEVGGVTNRTLAEDFDLTLATVRLDYDVVFEPGAVAYTVAPATWRQLFRQRVRWCRGALQVFRQHKGMFFNRKYKALGVFWLPYFLIAGFGGAIFEAIAILALPIIFLSLGAPIGMLKYGLIFVCILESICVFQYMVGVFLSKDSPRNLVFWAFAIKPLNLFLTWVRLVAIFQEVKGARRCW